METSNAGTVPGRATPPSLIRYIVRTRHGGSACQGTLGGLSPVIPVAAHHRAHNRERGHGLMQENDACDGPSNEAERPRRFPAAMRTSPRSPALRVQTRCGVLDGCRWLLSLTVEGSTCIESSSSPTARLFVCTACRMASCSLRRAINVPTSGVRTWDGRLTNRWPLLPPRG